MRAFRAKQVSTGVGIAAAIAATAFGFSLPGVWSAFPVAPEEVAQRIVLWTACEAFVFLTLVIAVARLARFRFFSESDIDAGGGAGTARAQALQAQLQNTLEQAVLAAVAHLAWLMLASPGWAMLAAVFAGYFCVGRLLFFVGYTGGAPARALGFGLTFYPSVALLVGITPAAAGVIERYWMLR